MRTLLIAAVLAVSASCATAQDPGQIAAQQAADAAQQAMTQAAQQAAQMAQQASEQAARDAQATQNAMNSGQTNLAPVCCYIAKPTFSMKAGTYSGTKTVKIRDTTRGAVIYYTTDGWTPTVASNRYTGPVTIEATTTLQAVAIGPVLARSLVASATYIIRGGNGVAGAQSSGVPTLSAAIDTHGQPELPEGMAVPLVFVSEVSSKTADVGDKIVLAVAEDIKAGDTVVIKKGTPASAIVTEAYKSGAGGAPGDVGFAVNALVVNGVTVKLRGGQSLEGEPKPPNATTLIPVVGVFGLFRHGKDAEIKQGAALTAYVDADTLLASATEMAAPSN